MKPDTPPPFGSELKQGKSNVPGMEFCDLMPRSALRPTSSASSLGRDRQREVGALRRAVLALRQPAREGHAQVPDVRQRRRTGPAGPGCRVRRVRPLLRHRRRGRRPAGTTTSARPTTRSRSNRATRRTRSGRCSCRPRTSTSRRWRSAVTLLKSLDKQLRLARRGRPDHRRARQVPAGRSTCSARRSSARRSIRSGSCEGHRALREERTRHDGGLHAG